MDNKSLSILSYITILGWLIALLVNKEQSDDFRKYHLRQSLGLFITAMVFNLILYILISLVPALFVLSYISYGFLVLIVIGCINASNNAKKPLPVIGNLFEGKFSFLG